MKLQAQNIGLDKSLLSLASWLEGVHDFLVLLHMWPIADSVSSLINLLGSTYSSNILNDLSTTSMLDLARKMGFIFDLDQSDIEHIRNKEIERVRTLKP